MNVKPGDLAYVVVPPGFLKTIDKKFVDVLPGGHCDLGTFSTGNDWVCKFHVPWRSTRLGVMVYQCILLDSWLRPIQDKPGNESFVTEARKTLPRKQPVTGPVTINERGEIA